jgi:enoyl-CoA hydratase
MNELEITAPDQGRFRALRVERSGALLVLTLNRPQRLNAVGDDMLEGLETVLTELRSDASVRAVLLVGEGRAFCSGGDVQSFAAQPHEPPSSAQRFEEVARSAVRLVEIFLAVPQPIVAAVQGYAMGLGATLALLCDVVVASETAVIADTHVPIGLVAGDGGALAWPLNLPMGAAKYYLLTGERLSGLEAARLGLVLKAVPEQELRAQAQRVALTLATLPPLAVQGTKAALNRVLRHRADLVMEHGAMLEAATFLSDDHQEAAAAFMAKRQATYRGR